MKFENFIADMGERPVGTTLDRFPDVNGNYELGNCRWATPIEQHRNTRANRWIEFNGERLVLQEWAERLDISKSALRFRLTKWPLDKALTTPKPARIDAFLRGGSGG